MLHVFPNVHDSLGPKSKTKPLLMSFLLEQYLISDLDFCHKEDKDLLFLLQKA